MPPMGMTLLPSEIKSDLPYGQGKAFCSFSRIETFFQTPGNKVESKSKTKMKGKYKASV